MIWDAPRWGIGLFCGCFVVATACGDDSSAIDAGAPDGAIADAPPECEVSMDCDDGLFCNGVESCVAGVCTLSDFVACDDGVECTLDFCDEDVDACVSAGPDLDGDGAADANCLDAEGMPVGADCDDSECAFEPSCSGMCVAEECPTGRDDD